MYKLDFKELATAHRQSQDGDCAMTKLERVRAAEPRFPGWEASQEERERYRAAHERWLPSFEEAMREEYGAEHTAHCVRQYRFMAETLAMSPAELEKRRRAMKERLRNLLPGGVNLTWPDGTRSEF